MNSLKKNQTWEAVQCPTGAKPMDAKWVFALKHNEDGEVIRYKARLAMRGFRQQQGVDYDETYVPVAKLATVREVI